MNIELNIDPAAIDHATVIAVIEALPLALASVEDRARNGARSFLSQHSDYRKTVDAEKKGASVREGDSGKLDYVAPLAEVYKRLGAETADERREVRERHARTKRVVDLRDSLKAHKANIALKVAAELAHAAGVELPDSE